MPKFALVACLAALSGAASGQGIITTIAGSTWAFPADGRPAAAAPLGRITALALDAQGDVYIADPDNAMVMKVNPAGVLTVVAGNGIHGFSGDFGPAVNASLNCPVAVAVDGKGNLYIADECAFRIREVTADGVISTVAGSGQYGTSEDGVRATEAALAAPSGVAADSAGNFYFSEAGVSDASSNDIGNKIRMVTAAGILSTVAGTGPVGFSGDGGLAVNAMLQQPNSLIIDSQGFLLFIDGGDHVRVRRFKPGESIATIAGGGSGGDGSAATSASINAFGIALDASGLLYIADSRANRIRIVKADGTIATVAGAGLFGYSGDGGPAGAATLANPQGVAVDSAGRIYVSDTENRRVRRVDATGVIGPLAGNGAFKFAGDQGPASAAFLNQPGDVVVSSAGDVFIADTLNHRVRKISKGIITTLAGNGLPGFSGDGGPAASAQLCYPSGLAIDSKNNVYVADTENGRVRMVKPDGTIVTVVGGGQSCGGNPGPAGNVSLSSPGSLAFDANDTLYLASGFRVVRFNGTGVTVVAGTGAYGATASPDGIPAIQADLGYIGAVLPAPDGSIYFSEIYRTPRIRKVSTSGILTTIAGPGTGASGDGGPATQATVEALGMRFDPSGNLLIADGSFHRVRRITGTTIDTVAGGGFPQFGNGDGGPALKASVNPSNVASDSAGAIYIAEASADRIRRVSSDQPAFTVSTSGLDFASAKDGVTPPDQTIQLTSPVSGLAYTASADMNWLSVRQAAGTIPATLLVTANPAGLPVGVSEARISITIPAANQVRVVTVDLTIAPGAQPSLATGSSLLEYTAVQGGAAINSALQVFNNGAGVLTFSVAATTTTGGAWLQVTPSGGSVMASSPQSITIQATPGSLTPGIYTGLITVAAAQTAQSLFVLVKLTVNAATQSIELSQTGLSFQATQGAAMLAPQSLGIINLGIGGMSWSAAATTVSGGNWLSVAPASGTSGPAGTSASFVQVNANPSNLPQGNYYGQVQINAPAATNSPQAITVALSVVANNTQLRPDVRPTGLIFVSSADPNQASQTITLTNYGATPITFTSGQSSADFQYIPQNGTITANQPLRIVVTPQSGLPVGIRRSTLTLAFSDGTIRLVDILVVTPPGPAAGASSRQGAPRATGCTPASLGLVFSLLGQDFTTGTSIPTPMEVRVVDSCGVFLTDGTVVASFSNGDRLLAMISTGNGYWDATWVPSPPIAGTAPRVSIRVDGLNLARTLSGFLQISGGVNPTPTGPAVASGGVVNAASPAIASPLAPGELISIFGTQLASSTAMPNPGSVASELAGTLVALKGTALPLLYVGSNQINTMVPLDVAPNTSYQLFVQQANQVAVPVEVLVAPAQPAIFTTSGSGSGQGAIVNPAGTLVDPNNPAHAKDTILIYASGLGVVTPAVPTGTPSPASPPAQTQANVLVSIGGIPAHVDFSGLAPGYFGLYQINAVVPDGVAPGDSVPVTITVGGETSPTVTIAVR